jgi:acetyl esterase/lipase
MSVADSFLRPVGRTIAAAILLSAATSLRAAETPSGSTGSTAAAFTVKVVKNLAYVEGPAAHPKKHKLDLYLPENAADFPVLIFIHGGAWVSGDKDYVLGLYGNIGRAFAKRGIGTVVINYRLSPDVAHPAHIQDVAKAVAWVKRNIKAHGGRPDQIFVSGHSAGGHLTALLASDESRLKAEGLSFADIKGAICLSGVYMIPEQGRLFDGAFTTDAKTRREASPLTHVSGTMPPVLVVYASNDLPGLGLGAEIYNAALKANKCACSLVRIENKNHFSIIVDVGKAGDKTTQAMYDFIAGRPGVTIPRTGTGGK